MGASPTFSSIILHVVIMIRPLIAIAIGALVVLAAVTEAASTKYEDDYSYGMSSSSYGEPSYEKYEDEYGYIYKTYEPSYRHKRSARPAVAITLPWAPEEGPAEEREAQNRGVDCGGHGAISCALCPVTEWGWKGKAFCGNNGQCRWRNNRCVPK